METQRLVRYLINLSTYGFVGTILLHLCATIGFLDSTRSRLALLLIFLAELARPELGGQFPSPLNPKKVTIG